MPDMKDSAATQAPSSFKQSLPDGSFGSEEGKDKMLPAPQHVDTVMYSEGETRPDNMRSSAEAGFSMRNYGEFAGRRGPMPRNASDELYLEGYGRNVADPRMSDDNAMAGPSPKAEPDKCDLYGDNRDGVLHNKNAHPGFAAVQKKIQGEGYSAKAAGAILASKTRGASKAAHKENPRLSRVKG